LGGITDRAGKTRHYNAGRIILSNAIYHTITLENFSFIARIWANLHGYRGVLVEGLIREEIFAGESRDVLFYH
jgi:hypothetical protein